MRKWLRIASPSLNPDDFAKQVALIRSSGAAFDTKNRTWWLEATPEVLNSSALGLLFQAAREHGTYVTVVSDDQPNGQPSWVTGEQPD